MLLTDLDTKSPQDEGAFLHLHHTKYGFPMYTGEGATKQGEWIGSEDPPQSAAIGLIVRGMESQTIQSFTRKQKARMMLDQTKSKVKFSQDDAEHESGLQFACALIVSFVNIEGSNGKPLEPTDENKRAFVELSDDISRQLLAFSRERDNFFKPLPSA